MVALAERSRVRDIVVVRINPVESEAVPKSTSAIRNRTAEIVFGHPLQVELERLQHARDLAPGPGRMVVARAAPAGPRPDRHDQLRRDAGPAGSVDPGSAAVAGASAAARRRPRRCGEFPRKNHAPVCTARPRRCAADLAG